MIKKLVIYILVSGFVSFCRKNKRKKGGRKKVYVFCYLLHILFPPLLISYVFTLSYETTASIRWKRRSGMSSKYLRSLAKPVLVTLWSTALPDWVSCLCYKLRFHKITRLLNCRYIYSVQPSHCHTPRSFNMNSLPNFCHVNCSMLFSELASDGLKGRVVEVCLADLKDNEDHSHRKIKFICEEVQVFTCNTFCLSKCISNFALCNCYFSSLLGQQDPDQLPRHGLDTQQNLLPR